MSSSSGTHIWRILTYRMMSSRFTATIAASTVTVTSAASSFMANPQFRGARKNVVQAARTGGLEPHIPATSGSNAGPSDRGRADQPVPGDQGGQILLGQAVAACGAGGHDPVTVLGARVPHHDLGIGGKQQPELGQHGAGFADRA